MDDKEIGNIRLKFSCDADWEKMEVVNGARYCGHCSKVVYDLTNAKQQEFLKILAENNNNVCGRFTSSQMAPVRAIPSWRKWVSAAMVLLVINILNSKAEAQQPIKTLKQANARGPEILTGEIIPIQQYAKANTQKQRGDKEAEIFVDDNRVLPEFPGGPGAYGKFLFHNIHYRKGMIDGRVIASFDVTKKGILENIKIERGVSKLNDAEVIRVLKLSPKWKPGTVDGKPATIKYMVPVNFQR